MGKLNRNFQYPMGQMRIEDKSVVAIKGIRGFFMIMFMVTSYHQKITERSPASMAAVNACITAEN